MYTGLSSKFVFDYYLLLLKFTQIAINSYTSSNKINGTASDIQSLLMEPNIYSDVCLLVCFHDGYFQENLQWMMQSKALTEVCGFQVQEMAVRYFVMYRELRERKLEVGETLAQHRNGFFYHFIASLNIMTDKGPLLNDTAQRTKAAKFCDMAIESLQKHFIRWCSKKLLPAALMAERPLAIVVARVLTGAPPAPIEFEEFDDGRFEKIFNSRVHGGIKLSDFDSFIRDAVTAVNAGVGDNEDGHVDRPIWKEEVKQAAALLLQGVDFRNNASFKAQPLC